MKEAEAFSIKQAAEQTGISEDTIRYYEKIALLPRAERKPNGHRVYYLEDIGTIKLISCLKKTGLALDEMRPFLTVSADADPVDYPELVQDLMNHRENIVSQIASLQKVVDYIDLKLEQGVRPPDCLAEESGKLAGRGGKAEQKRPKSLEEMKFFAG
ncbi:MerR family transcriptional regulator [Paenibacillus oralis]|uniref:MerR family transcriptional regulator n=1 Tax=Paenibacillus oralis TaxID=2490856 RepID=A0A3P3U645_9BACL|nr:MerR family transcriptional regulator [Paenibacillus oralis]RRJ65841.1 MerR family transcriptional regulator [Paenibacillus oralis]